jgi:hypothetical protein
MRAVNGKTLLGKTLLYQPVEKVCTAGSPDDIERESSTRLDVEVEADGDGTV